MDFAEHAFSHKLKGDTEKAQESFLLAFECELKAAESYKNSTIEPTRSVLYRSAATLACDCGNLREAERLVAIALSGDPPEDIADELFDLLEDIYYKHGLETQDSELDMETLDNSDFYRLMIECRDTESLSRDLAKEYYRSIAA
ncbi:MAG: hypothetical protein HQK97_03500 [Nitrospirae bacterium]|nr:hypothetical protein [Nitrospirota bacterium]